MARKQQAKQEDDGPPQVGEWIVTFSDCMTLLLCFFVLLLTFSSFEETDYSRFKGSFRAEEQDSMFPDRKDVPSSSVPPPPAEVDRTVLGSDTKTDAEPKEVEVPKRRPLISETEAYKDRRVFNIRSSRLFLARGSILTHKGKEFLKMLSSLMKTAPCRVIIGESDGSDVPISGREESGLNRSWSIVDYFTRVEGLRDDRFSICAAVAEVPERFRGEAVVQIALLTRSLH